MFDMILLLLTLFTRSTVGCRIFKKCLDLHPPELQVNRVEVFLVHHLNNLNELKSILYCKFNIL